MFICSCIIVEILYFQIHHPTIGYQALLPKLLYPPLYQQTNHRSLLHQRKIHQQPLHASEEQRAKTKHYQQVSDNEKPCRLKTKKMQRQEIAD